MPFEIEFIRNMQRSITELEVGMTKEREQDEKPIAFWDTQEGRLIPAVPLSSERTCFEVPLVPLYLHPTPRPEFVRLSEEEIRTWNIVGHESLLDFVRAIEDALEEKNNGH